jgi:hypothetical protein
MSKINGYDMENLSMDDFFKICETLIERWIKPREKSALLLIVVDEEGRQVAHGCQSLSAQFELLGTLEHVKYKILKSLEDQI